METRFLTALLARIRGENLVGDEVRVPLNEVLAPSGRRPNDEDYEVMAQMLQRLTKPCLLLDFSSPLNLPLLSSAHHEKQQAFLRVRLSSELLPYFAQPAADDARAPREQLLKLRTPAAYHFYWLLREYASHGIRLMELSQLGWQMGVLADKANVNKFNPSSFYSRLSSIQQQLALTDLPFTMDMVKRGKRLHLVRILFSPLFPVCPIDSGLSTESGQDAISMLLNGLLVFFRFGLGAACAIAVAATTGSN